MNADLKAPANCRTLIDPDEALRLVLQNAVCAAPRKVPLAEACGLQLAEPIAADGDYPPFPRAMMDGYAVRTADAGQTVEVIGEVAAGNPTDVAVSPGRCLEIMTGAPCPSGTEAVVKKEQTRRQGNRVTLPGKIAEGGHIARQGSECLAGRLVLQPGQTITPLAVAVAASFGVESIRITPRPSLAVITTGGELVPAGQKPGPGQIRDSNGPMLVAMVCDMGIQRPVHLHAEDRLDRILHALGEVADKDVVLLTGGVSVGNYDLVPEAIQRFGAEPVFHKVTQKPGKPLLLAIKGRQLLFGLPGNPLSSHLCFQRYVAAAIRKTEGKPPVPDPMRAQLAVPLPPKRSRTHFVTARAEPDDSSPTGWRIHPLPGTSSADVFAPCQASCYVEVPPGKTEIPAGEILSFAWIGGAPWTN